MRWLGRAAAVVAIAATLGWGLSQAHRASVSAADAQSYRNVLSTLGGKEFRVGTLDSHVAHPIKGSVVLYDSGEGQSWGIVLVRAPGVTGTATVDVVQLGRHGRREQDHRRRDAQVPAGRRRRDLAGHVEPISRRTTT